MNKNYKSKIKYIVWFFIGALIFNVLLILFIQHRDVENNAINRVMENEKNRNMVLPFDTFISIKVSYYHKVFHENIHIESLYDNPSWTTGRVILNELRPLYICYFLNGFDNLFYLYPSDNNIIRRRYNLRGKSVDLNIAPLFDKAAEIITIDEVALYFNELKNDLPTKFYEEIDFDRLDPVDLWRLENIIIPQDVGFRVRVLLNHSRDPESLGVNSFQEAPRVEQVFLFPPLFFRVESLHGYGEEGGKSFLLNVLKALVYLDKIKENSVTYESILDSKDGLTDQIFSEIRTPTF